MSAGGHTLTFGNALRINRKVMWFAFVRPDSGGVAGRFIIINNQDYENMP
jgi:hypothetical protein